VIGGFGRAVNGRRGMVVVVVVGSALRGPRESEDGGREGG